MGSSHLNPPETVQQEKPDYAAFAKQTYATMHTAIDQSMQQGGERSILTVIGEGHVSYLDYSDPMGASAESETPFVAGAFTEVAALEASKRLFGSENTILSVEMEPEDLADFISTLKDEDFVFEAPDIEVTMYHAIVYAHKNNIEIVPNDFASDLYDSDEERDLMMIDAISAVSRDDERKSVVHIGGAAHLSNMSGYTDEQIANSAGQLKFSSELSPFHNIYEQTVFVNTFQDPNHYILDRNNPNPARLLGELNYMMNSENAIQVTPPGPIDAEVLKNLVSMVEDAANEVALEASHTLEANNKLNTDDAAPAWTKCGW